MFQSNIYIDIGNSAVKWRTLESDVYSRNVDEFLISTLPQADSAWVSAVANLDIVEDLKSLFKEFHLVESQKKCSNLIVAYDDPSSLGSDRFLAMLGAMNQFSKKPLLVIDIGSAMTFDVIDRDGIHQGGVIMPGLGALRISFSKFETTDLTTNIDGLARNTTDAWKNGTRAMLISSINDQIEKFNEIYSDGMVTICGGFVD